MPYGTEKITPRKCEIIGVLAIKGDHMFFNNDIQKRGLGNSFYCNFIFGLIFLTKFVNTFAS